MGWWKKVLAGVEGVEGRWFWGRMGQSLGDGGKADFWEGIWAGDRTMKERYPRLFQLSTKRDAKVKDMGEWVEGRWGWHFDWRRELRGWEKEKETEMNEFLHAFTVKDGELDKWTWGEVSREYSVKEAYESITNTERQATQLGREKQCLGTLWKSIAPFKCQAMAWRLLRDRLPTRANLVKKRIIEEEAAKCSLCHRVVESARHLLLECNEVSKLWYKIVSWIGCSWAQSRELMNHMTSFSSLLGKGKVQRWLRGLWICVVWVIWRWRNSTIFEKKEWDFRRMEEEIKCRFWSWCMVKGVVEQNSSFVEWTKKNLCESWNVN